MNHELLDIVESIKKDIVSTRNAVLENANQELLGVYFRIGKCISDNASYRSNFINTLSETLKMEFPDATGYSPRNLARMKKFYEEYRELSILPMPLAKLPWTHNIILMEKVKNLQERNWYAEKLASFVPGAFSRERWGAYAQSEVPGTESFLSENLI